MPGTAGFGRQQSFFKRRMLSTSRRRVSTRIQTAADVRQVPATMRSAQPGASRSKRGQRTAPG